MNKINENTWVPLGKVIAVFLIGIGGIMWLDNVASSVTAHGKAIDQFMQANIKSSEALSEIRRDIAVIKVQLEDLKDEKQRRK